MSRVSSCHRPISHNSFVLMPTMKDPAMTCNSFPWRKFWVCGSMGERPANKINFNIIFHSPSMTDFAMFYSFKFLVDKENIFQLFNVLFHWNCLSRLTLVRIPCRSRGPWRCRGRTCERWSSARPSGGRSCRTGSLPACTSHTVDTVGCRGCCYRSPV